MARFCDNCNIFGLTFGFTLLQGAKRVDIYLCATCKKAFGMGREDFFATKDINQLFEKHLFNKSIETKDPAFNVTKFNINSDILEITKLVNLQLIEKLYKDPDMIKTIDRRLFEEIISELWRGFGYSVELTARTRDGGKDIVAVSNDASKVKLLIECKRPDPGNKIGVRAVRELYGVKMIEGASKAILATTSYFTEDAKVLLENKRWELSGADYNEINNWIHTYLKNKK